jgi:hypothetical protein
VAAGKRASLNGERASGARFKDPPKKMRPNWMPVDDPFGKIAKKRLYELQIYKRQLEVGTSQEL